MNIPLKNSTKVAEIDEEEYPKVAKYGWNLHSKGYAVCWEYKPAIFMHTLIMCCQCDHQDRNPLNNRKANLRKCNGTQNQYNQPIDKRNSTGYKGVTYHKKNDKYVAHIRNNGHLTYLGSYETKEEAALAYNNAAKEIAGEFALLNVLPSAA